MKNPHLSEVARLAPKYFKFKRRPWDEKCISFLAKDDGWYLTATMRYQDIFTEEEFSRIHNLVHQSDWDAPLFRVKIHEEFLEIRAEVRLAIFTLCWPEEDVPHVLSLLEERWKALIPLIDRAKAGDDMAKVIGDAKTALEKLNRLAG